MFAKFRKRKATRFVSVNKHNCIACWECVAACPENVLGKVDFLGHRHVRIINSDACVGCCRCVKVCPKGVFLKLG
ncbi:MAG: 4Fe-4S binding protein [Muribaculaceae bacterium]|nr:4Fe-4S binding protein [Muribaculaceae bacterium]